MKKIITFTAASLFMVSTAFAGTIPLSATSTGLSLWGAKTGGTAASGTNLIGKTSTGVGLGMNASSTGYSAMTQHKNGTKAFGSAHDSTSVYSKDVTVGTPDNTTLNTGADSFTGGGSWTTM